MKNVEIRIKKNLEKSTLLANLQEKTGLISEDIAKKMTTSLGGNVRSWATLYSGYRSGSKNIPTRVIPVLANILNVSKEKLRMANIERKNKKELVILLPTDMVVTPLLDKFHGKSVTVADLVFGLHQFLSDAETKKSRRLW